MHLLESTIHNLLLAGSLLLAVSGCGASNQVPAGPSDATQAKEALTRVLDTWKNGSSIEALRAMDPAIYASDEDWSSGSKLVEYKLQGEPETFGHDLRFRVLLKMNQAGGGAKSKVAVYNISTVPVISVARSDVTE